MSGVFQDAERAGGAFPRGVLEQQNGLETYRSNIFFSNSTINVMMNSTIAFFMINSLFTEEVLAMSLPV